MFRSLIFFRFPGSPPRMRGTVSVRAPKLFLSRITPAHAGNRNVFRLSAVAHEGSPPRMRGTGYGREPSLHETRITPAHAGNRLKESMLISRQRDHPRACGEQIDNANYLCYNVGSPPRMRGTGSIFDVGEST